MTKITLKEYLMIGATQITNDVFISALEKALKAQHFTKKERAERIDRYLKDPSCDRDLVLDVEETKARSFKIKPKIPTEKAEQIELVRWFKESYPGTVIMMIRNDGYRRASEKTEQMVMGLHPGAADLYIPALHCWVEMKRIKGWKLSPEQENFRDYVLGIGDNWILGVGAEDAKEKIKSLLNVLIII